MILCWHKANVLRGAAKLIKKKNAWCQEVCAKDSSGRETTIFAKDINKLPVSWCAMGAIWKISKKMPGTDYESLFKEISNVSKYKSFSHWQDDPERTQQEVVKILKIAEWKLRLKAIDNFFFGVRMKLWKSSKRKF